MFGEYGATYLISENFDSTLIQIPSFSPCFVLPDDVWPGGTHEAAETLGRSHEKREGGLGPARVGTGQYAGRMTSRTRTAARAHSTRWGVALGAIALTVATLTACAPAAESTPPADAGSSAPAAPPATDAATSPASPVPTTDAASPCDILSDDQLTDLLGDTVGTGSEVDVPGSTLTACQYGSGSTGLLVAQTPAVEWAQQLPGLVDAVLAAPIDEGLRAQIEDAAAAVESGEDLTPDQACEYFSQLLEVGGLEPGTTASVSYLPDLETATAANGQQCENGTYTMLTLIRENIADDPTVVQQLLDQLANVG